MSLYAHEIGPWVNRIARAIEEHGRSLERAAATSGPAYPYADGETLVLGPETFVAKDGAVLCWKGQNYVKQEP